MRFTITPLGSAGGRTVDQVVADIVRYLQPRQEHPPSRGTDAPPPAPEAAAYYADRGEEPGRWLGHGAAATGLVGEVAGEDFARVLAGRDPNTGARLITAQGSAGRRPRLGVGNETRRGIDGEPLYDERDAAAALGIPASEVARMLDVGAALSAARLAATGPDADPGTVPSQPEGSYLVPAVHVDGTRLVSEAELARCEAARAVGPTLEDITSGGEPDDQFPLAEAARLAGVTAQYLRSLCRQHELHRDGIERALAEGRQPPRAYVVACRDLKGRWRIRRRHLGEFLSRRKTPAVRVGYDLTLTTEKSLGVLALLGDESTRAAALAAIDAGNDWALRWLETHAAGARSKGETVPVQGWTVASFRHLTSRALDPFPHHHNVVANTVVDAEGTRRALDARGLYQLAEAASALATAEMRHQLTRRLGVRWRRSRSGGWEIEGIPDEVLRAFSRRRNEIDDALAELEEAIGRRSTLDELQTIVASTRPPKEAVDAATLVAGWWERAAGLGFCPADLDACTGLGPSPQEPDPESVFAALAAPDGLCAGGSVFNRSDVLAALAVLPVCGPDGSEQPLIASAARLEELADAFLASAHVVALGHADTGRLLASGNLYTTGETLALQQRIVDRFTAGLRNSRAVVPATQLEAALASHSELTAEQRQLVRAFCTSGHAMQCAIGRAGAGKTTTMRAAAAAWTQAGYKVLGAAVKGEAARTLGAATGIPTETLAWHLAHEDPATSPLDARTVLIVDEASTVSDADLDRLLWHAHATGAAIRLIGDPAQHGAVAAGGMYRVLCERHPHHTPVLAQTHRVQDPNDRAAIAALLDGRIAEALGHLDAAGHLHVVSDELSLHLDLLRRWWSAHQAGLEHPMVDRRNATRRQLNLLAHRLLQATGEVGGEEIEASGERRFSVGDRVVARAGDRSLHPEGQPKAYVRNGSLGTVVGLKGAGRAAEEHIVVAFDGGGTIKLPRAFFDEHEISAGRRDVGIDHAYAVTSYSVQGATYEVSTSRIDERTSRAEAYVDITRGRSANHLYLTRAADPLDGEGLPKAPSPPLDVTVTSRLTRSGPELTAWELTNERPEPGGRRAPAALSL